MFFRITAEKNSSNLRGRNKLMKQALLLLSLQALCNCSFLWSRPGMSTKGRICFIYFFLSPSFCDCEWVRKKAAWKASFLADFMSLSIILECQASCLHPTTILLWQAAHPLTNFSQSRNVYEHEKMTTGLPWWVNSGIWWWTGRPGVLQFTGSQKVGHDWGTELNWTELSAFPIHLKLSQHCLLICYTPMENKKFLKKKFFEFTLGNTDFWNLNTELGCIHGRPYGAQRDHR